jgi:gamma-glutamyl hercynylcysteine S-oxide synthase
MASIATHQAAPASHEVQEPETPVASGGPTLATTTALAALGQAREHTLSLVAHLSGDELTRVHSPIMSPLVWDLAHIAAYEDLWLGHRHAGLPLLRPELASMYDAFETPRAVRGDIEALGPADARAYMDAVRKRVNETIARTGVGDGQVCEMVVRHELQHSETMRQTLALAGLLGPGEPRFEPLTDLGGETWIDIPAGPFEMGAEANGFAYDNERPRHTVEMGAFQLARLPVTNAEWAAAGGGEPAGHPDAPVCHVSWHEAEAYARTAGARLPSEAEWEKVAAMGVLDGVGQVWEWTNTTFTGYPGFVAYPYREYSEVFFDKGYKVLRGGSWATHARVKTVTFRNWDLPQRSQIFAGLRLARDVS